MNYSNITLKVSGGAGKKESTEKAGVADIEERINTAVLRVPECGVCTACTEKTTRRKLCKARLDVRDKMMSTTFKKVLMGDAPKKKGSKKRKTEQAASSSKKGSKKSTATASTASGKKSPKLMIKKADGQLKQRVTSNGNKRMAIPEELVPEFCRRIGVNGTGERVAVINQFVEDHPTISIRQVTLKMTEMTMRERPAWVPEHTRKQGAGRAFMFYLRPRYYHYLPEDERPDNWEAIAAEDERQYQREKERLAEARQGEAEHLKDIADFFDSGEDQEPPKKKSKPDE